MSLTPGEDEDLASWLRLVLTPGVGPVSARALLERFGLPAAIFESAHGPLEGVVGSRLAGALRAAAPQRDRRIRQALDWAGIEGHHLVTLADPAYPPLLRHLADAPVLLHVSGRRDALLRPMVAIVGSRNPTAGGVANASAFALALSEAGWTVASGMALGIDAAAHDGALAGRAGTVAVVGTGLDVVYPSRHHALAERIAAHGAIVSELPLGTGPTPAQFPRRNRLIAGLARGVLVVEAALHSGSLITARHAGEYGRDVFAIPGSIHSPLARGCHALIRQGAVLTESAEDVLAELPVIDPGPRPPPALARSACAHDQPAPVAERMGDPTQDPLLEAIGFEPVLPDRLAEQLGLTSGALGARLVVLEIGGRLQRLPDGRVVRPAPIG
jgi:DNA processing protein